MLRRFRLPGCLLVATSLAAPGVYAAEPSPNVEAEVEAEVEAGDETTDDAGSPDPAPAADPQPTADTSPQETPEDDVSDDEDLEDEASDDEDLEDDVDEGDAEEGGLETQSQVPERMRRLQRLGWYHVLGTFALGTTAGLLAGLAERDEDRAFRIASGYDLENGRATLYSDRQDEYERILDRGQAFQTSAIVLGAAAGATAIAAITLFAIDARRRPSSTTARRTRIGPGSVEVRF